MDNASFHKSNKVNELIEKCGARILFLPKYSPDLNPIEHFWYPLKNFIRKYLFKKTHILFEDGIYAGFLNYIA